MIQSFPQLPIQGQVIPHSASLRHIDEGDGVEVPEDLEADLGWEISDEIDVEPGVELLDDIGDDRGG